MSSNYMCAGFETLATLMDLFVESDKYNKHFTRSSAHEFFKNTCTRFLHSFGQNFKNVKKMDRYMRNEVFEFEYCRAMGYFDDMEFIVDSGGFQISTGRLDRKESETLYNMYHKFLEEHNNIIDKAFVLDVPPGPGCEIFNDFDDVYKWNKRSYDRAANYPDHIRNKMIYVHHFRTPKLWEIYGRLLKDEGMFEKFRFHATGGIVANMFTDIVIPITVYALPLVPLLNLAKKHGRKELHFHILGGAGWRDLLFYELFTIHVMKKHGIKLNITYDSSGIFKSLMIGRIIWSRDQDIIRRMDVRTANLNNSYNGKITIEQKYKLMMDHVAYKYGFKKLNYKSIYCSNSGTFHPEIRIYSAFFMLDMYKEVEEWMKIEAVKIYELYESENFEEFNSEVLNLTQNLNQGKITRKQKSKATSLKRTLDLLGSLDEDHCEYLVNKFLAKDEFVELSNQQKLLTF